MNKLILYNVEDDVSRRVHLDKGIRFGTMETLPKKEESWKEGVPR